MEYEVGKEFEKIYAYLNDHEERLEALEPKKKNEEKQQTKIVKRK